MLTNDEIRAKLEDINNQPIAEHYKAQLRLSFLDQLEQEKSPPKSTHMGGVRQEYEIEKTPDNFKWFQQYTTQFIPRFISIKEQTQEYTLCWGELKGLHVRRLQTGDYMFLASMVPSVVSHLAGDKDLFDDVTGEPKNPLLLLTAVIRRALEDWDYTHHQPTDFQLTVLHALVQLWRYKDDMGQVFEPPFTVDDLLNSDPEEVVGLVVGMYRANAVFFTKILDSNGVTRAVTAILAGIFGNIKSVLSGLTGLFTQTVQQTHQTTLAEDVPSGSGGVKSGGKTSLSRRTVKQKASLPEVS